MKTEYSDGVAVFIFTRDELRALLACASKDAARVNLCTLRLEGATGHAVTTDGHRMMLAESVGSLHRHAPSITLERASLDTAAKYPKVAEIRVSFKAHDDPAPTAEIYDRHTHQIGVVALRTAQYLTFPPWRQVIPAPGREPTGVAVNPRYIADAAAVLAKALPERKDGRHVIPPYIRIETGGELDPVMLYGEDLETGTRWSHVLMPARSSLVGFMPQSLPREEVQAA